MFYKMTTILHDFTKWPKAIVHDFPLEHMELEPTFTNQGNPVSFRTRESKNHVKTVNFFLFDKTRNNCGTIDSSLEIVLRKKTL